MEIDGISMENLWDFALNVLRQASRRHLSTSFCPWAFWGLAQRKRTRRAARGRAKGDAWRSWSQNAFQIKRLNHIRHDLNYTIYSYIIILILYINIVLIRLYKMTLYCLDVFDCEGVVCSPRQSRRPELRRGPREPRSLSPAARGRRTRATPGGKGSSESA